MSYFKITGGPALSGEVRVHGAKNAVLPMLCAALLTSKECRFHDVPDISDVKGLLDIFQFLGAETKWNKEHRIVSVKAEKLLPERLAECILVKQLRASILCVGPLLARFGEVRMKAPGGCKIGLRSTFIHVYGFQAIGAEVLETVPGELHLRYKRQCLKDSSVLLVEASVTGTENLAIFLAAQPESSEICFAAVEPYVNGLLHMLVKMGARIEGFGTHHLRITGSSNLLGGDFQVPPDGMVVGTYAIAAAVTGGNVKIYGVDHPELFSFLAVLKRIGLQFETAENCLHIKPSSDLSLIPKLQTSIFPGFPTDLQNQVGLLLTQCHGESLIFETLFENRLAYLLELQKMGADVEFVNAHQAKVRGKTSLKAADVTCSDLRAGATLILAGLIAKGTTIVRNIEHIDRGYEHFEENLRSLGAIIERLDD